MDHTMPASPRADYDLDPCPTARGLASYVDAGLSIGGEPPNASVAESLVSGQREKSAIKVRH